MDYEKQMDFRVFATFVVDLNEDKVNLYA